MSVEERTDGAAEAPWQALGEGRTDRLADLLWPIAVRLTEQNDGYRNNPMAIRLAVPR